MPTPLTDADKVLRNDTGKDIVDKLDAIKDALESGSGSGDHITLTQAMYDALVEAGTVDPNAFYFITDANPEAEYTAYDNTSSGLTADDVQDAIDELNTKDNTKMDKANPTGTGKLSLNRASGNEGNYSVAIGYGNTASGYISYAEGENTIANHRAQHVFGQNNVADASTEASTARGNYIEIVGNGSNDANRSNARTLDWSGNEVLAGGLMVNGNQPVSTMINIDVSSLSTSINDKASWDSAFSSMPTIYNGMVFIAFKSGYKVICFATKTSATWGSIMGMTNDNLNPYFYTMANGTGTLHRLAYV